MSGKWERLGEWLGREVHCPAWLKRVAVAFGFFALGACLLGLDALWIVGSLHGRWEYTPPEIWRWFAYGGAGTIVALALVWIPTRTRWWRHILRGAIVAFGMGHAIIGPEGSLVPSYILLYYAAPAILKDPEVIAVMLSQAHGMLLPFGMGVCLSLAIEKVISKPTN